MSILIGLHGRRGSGKDATFEGIHNWSSVRGVRAARRGFADSLKLSFARLFLPDCGLDEAVNWCNILKDTAYSQSKLSIRWGNHSEDGTTTFIEHIVNGRQALQRYGTEGHRDVFGEDFWVDALLPEPLHRDEIEPRWARNFIGPMDFGGDSPEICVVTDVRFDNEADRIHQLGGKIWHIVRPVENGGIGDKVDSHASELRLPDEKIDEEIYNDGGIEALHVKAHFLMQTNYAEVAK